MFILFFSCLSSTVDAVKPVQPFLVKVKVDRGEQYKIAYRWPLAELKLVDGKTLDQVGLIFFLWKRTWQREMNMKLERHMPGSIRRFLY